MFFFSVFWGQKLRMFKGFWWFLVVFSSFFDGLQWFSVVFDRSFDGF